MEIPDVELVVEGAAKADANEVGGEEGRDDLYAVVKAKGRGRRARSWDGGRGQGGSKAKGQKFWGQTAPWLRHSEMHPFG